MTPGPATAAAAPASTGPVAAGDALDALIADEQTRFEATHPRSLAAWRDGQRHWLYGAPSHWMRRWIGGAPLTLDGRPRGYRARVTDADGLDYADFCLGDTGGMCGHGHPAVAEALARQASVAASAMLPGEDAAWVGAELARRFGLPYWTLTTSASDANRAAIRLARMVTGRPRVLVFSGCYHGSVEEAHVELDQEGRVVMRNGLHPNGFPHDALSAVVPFNDLDALERTLSAGDVACVLAEPAMTNYGMIAPDPGFHDALRALTRRTGTLLVIDETHTVSQGPGGCTRAWGLAPDVFVVGKAIAGGLPAGAFALTEALAQQVWRVLPKVSPWVRQSAHAGFGGTLAGNAVTVAAMRAVLEHVLTDAGYATMQRLADRIAAGMRATIAHAGRPWYVAQIGARIETMFAAHAPRNADDVRRARDGRLEGLLHLYLMNRGVLITPFHAMMLTCPATVDADVDAHLAAFDAFARAVPA